MSDQYLLKGNGLTYGGSPKWMATDNEENFNDATLDSSWRDKWEQVKITYDLNSQGYRAKEWSEYDWENTIVMVGDSCTTGVGIPNNLTVSEILSRRIGKEVVNLGVNGSSNMFVLYNLARVVKHFNPYAVIVQWSVPDRYVNFSEESTGNTRIEHRGSWSEDLAYKRYWVKNDNFLFQDFELKNVASCLNIKRFVDYVPECWTNQKYQKLTNTLSWIKNDHERARDRLHPNGIVYERWANTIIKDFEKNGWLD